MRTFFIYIILLLSYPVFGSGNGDTMYIETPYSFNTGAGVVKTYYVDIDNPCQDTFIITIDLTSASVPDKFKILYGDSTTYFETPYMGSGSATYYGYALITPDEGFVQDSIIPSDYYWAQFWPKALFRLEFRITGPGFYLQALSNQNSSTAYSIYIHQPEYINSPPLPQTFTSEVSCFDRDNDTTIITGICDTLLITEYYLDPGLDLNISYDTCVEQYSFITLFANQNLSNFMFDGMLSNSIEFYVTDTTTIFVQGNTPNGCIISGRVKVNANITKIYIPNAFTPNNDGVNDYFEIFTKFKYKTAELFIYDRWGGLVHQVKSYNTHFIRWDGSEFSPNVFVYVLKITKNDGTQILRDGDVTILK